MLQATTSAKSDAKPPARETGRPFVQKTNISLENGANLWKVEFGRQFRVFEGLDPENCDSCTFFVIFRPHVAGHDIGQERRETPRP